MCLLNLSPVLQSCYSPMGLPAFFLTECKCFELFSAHSQHFSCWGGLAEGVCLGSVLVECQLVVPSTKVLQSAHSPGRRSSYCFLILFSVCIWILVTQREDRWTIFSFCISKCNIWARDNVRSNVSISFRYFIWFAQKRAWNREHESLENHKDSELNPKPPPIPDTLTDRHACLNPRFI